MIKPEELHPNDQIYWSGYVSYICGKWEICRRYSPRFILEIGVRAGYSAWAFLHASPQAKYVGIDNYSYGEYPEWARKNLLKGVNPLLIIKHDTQKIEKIDFLEEKPDLIHIDGDHTKNGVMHDLDLCFEILADSGVMLIDDYDRVPEVFEGIEEWCLKHTGEIETKYCETHSGDILIGRKGAIIQSLNPKPKIDLNAPRSPKNEFKNEINSKLLPRRKNVKKLLVFHHGLGDLIMFRSLYEEIQRRNPHVDYTLALISGTGFTPLIPNAVETPAGSFDYEKFCQENGFASYQIVAYAMSERSGKTKNELCALKEFGFDFVDTFPHDRLLKNHTTKVVGVCFQGTCLPGSTNPTTETAQSIWNEIIEAGCIPYEIMFKHIWHNPVNSRHFFIDNTTRNLQPNIRLLLSTLRGCDYFIGVSSGVWAAALTQLDPEKVCLLEKGHKLSDYVRNITETNSIDINNYQKGRVKEWLKNTLL